MAETFRGVIARARDLLGDATGMERYTTATLMRAAHDALSAIAIAKPQLFNRVEAINCDPANGPVQEIPVSWSALVDVLYVIGADTVLRSVRKADRALLDRTDPSWMSKPAGVPLQWAPIPGDDRRFLLSPPPEAGTQLKVLATIFDKTFLLADPLPVPDAYAQAIAYFIAAQALGTEDEDMNDPKSSKYLSIFMQFIGADDRTQERIRAKQAAQRSGAPE